MLHTKLVICIYVCVLRVGNPKATINYGQRILINKRAIFSDFTWQFIATTAAADEQNKNAK